MVGHIQQSISRQILKSPCNIDLHIMNERHESEDCSSSSYLSNPELKSKTWRTEGKKPADKEKLSRNDATSTYSLSMHCQLTN